MAIGTTAAIIGAAAIGGAASLAGGAMQAGAAQSASQAQADAADKSLALQEKIYEENVERQAPWLESGEKALNAYMGEMGLSDDAKAGTFQSGFRETPGYQFALKQGTDSVKNNLAALGMKNSGRGMKAISDYTTGLADQTYNRYLDRLSAASVGGQAQASNTAQMGQNYANSASQAMQDAGAAQASGYVGAANAWSNALGNISNNAGWALGMGSNNYGQGFGLSF